MLEGAGVLNDATSEDGSADSEEPDPELGEINSCNLDEHPVASKKDSDDKDDDEFEVPAPYPMSSNIFNATLSTFGDVIDAAHAHTSKMEDDEDYAKAAGRANRLKILSLKTSMDSPAEVDARPCFALRTLVKERLAAIIATDVGRH